MAQYLAFCGNAEVRRQKYVKFDGSTVILAGIESSAGIQAEESIVLMFTAAPTLGGCYQGIGDRPRGT